MHKQPSKAKLRDAVRVTAYTMRKIAKTTGPMRKDFKRFLEQHAAWLEEQLKP